jgi:hypothetical protein
MEDYGYWIFLMILYLLSAFMKKKKREAAYRKLEEVEEVESAWETPKFIKELLPDLVETEDNENDEIFQPVVEVVKNDVDVKPSLEYEREVPLEEVNMIYKDLSTIEDHKEIKKIKKPSPKNEILSTSFFKKPQDVKIAVIYKEILDKPRALRRRFR